MNQDPPGQDPANGSMAAVGRLMRLIERLRGRNGCPWDRKQTPRTMARYLAEEIFELLDAVESDQTDEVCQELGDVLFLVLFIVDMFKGQGRFDLNRVAAVNTEKMIRRHPHVFGPDTVESSDGVKKRWQQIKQAEKSAADRAASALDSVPRGMPALMRAYKMSDRAAKTGFDWHNTVGVVEKVDEEWEELRAAIDTGRRNDIDVEFGDLVFTLVNLARFAKIHPETALAGANVKFEKRFRRLESIVAAEGRTIDSLTAERLDQIWERIKREEKADQRASDR